MLQHRRGDSLHWRTQSCRFIDSSSGTAPKIRCWGGVKPANSLRRRGAGAGLPLWIGQDVSIYRHVLSRRRSRRQRRGCAAHRRPAPTQGPPRGAKRLDARGEGSLPKWPPGHRRDEGGAASRKRAGPWMAWGALMQRSGRSRGRRRHSIRRRNGSNRPGRHSIKPRGRSMSRRSHSIAPRSGSNGRGSHALSLSCRAMSRRSHSIAPRSGSIGRGSHALGLSCRSMSRGSHSIGPRSHSMTAMMCH